MIDAVVLGSALNALGIVRSLGCRGIRVAVVSRSARGIAGYSRFTHRHLVLPARNFDPDAILAGLELEQGRATLFLTEELDVMACLENVEAWRAAFRTYLYTPHVAAELLSKSTFDELARIYGARVPRAIVVNAGAPAGDVEGLRFPVAVKPVRRDDQYAARFDKAYKVASYGDLRELVCKLQSSGMTLVVQEWIEGADGDIYFNFVFLDENGELRSSFVGQKILCWPPDVGGTASCVAAPQYHELLTTQTVEFLQRIGFRGLLGMEYKRDARDGQFYMVEPTVYRTDYQHEVAALSHCNLLAMIHACCGDYPPPREQYYARERYWVDFPAARYSASVQGKGRATPTGVRRADAYFRTGDPLPGLVHYFRYINSRVSAAARRTLESTSMSASRKE